MKAEIINLRQQGKSYREISAILGCSKGIISYHLNESTKQKQRAKGIKQNIRRNEIVKNLKLKYDGKCSLCGYNKCLQALEFHHIDKTKKLFEIGNGLRNKYTAQDLEKEAQKCVLICSNCHREIHAGITSLV